MAVNVWGNAGNEAFALPMDQLIPTNPLTQGYMLAWNTITGAIGYAPLNVNFTTGDMTLDTGNLGVSAAGRYQVAGIPVVGARRTGWAAATGIATRTAFDTTTVTTQQLAERMKALLDDLIAHGLIGA